MNDLIKELNDVLIKVIEDDDFLGLIIYREEVKIVEVELEFELELELEFEVKRLGMDFS